MPKWEFECRMCDGITGIYLHDGDRLNKRAVRCEHCHAKQVRLILYVEHTGHMIAILQECLSKMAQRIEDLENGEPSGQDYEVKN